MNEVLSYYTAVITIVLMTQITGLVLVVKNNNLNKYKRHGFILTFALLIWATILEWSTNTILAIAPAYFIHLRKVLKCIELSIAPILLVECTFNVFSIKVSKKEQLISRILLTLHMFLEIFSIPGGFIFGITEDNVYYHGNFYWIYTASLLIAGFFLAYKLIAFCKHYQNQNIIVLFLMLLILITGSVIRFVNNEIRIDWLVTTIVVIFLYIYYNDIAMHIDFLTKLLNQRSYNNEIDSLNFPAAIIIFDIDNFKCINDTYGHNYGDEMIALIGGLIKTVFQGSGKCFRIGGDEFAVLQTKNLDSVEALIEDLSSRLNTQREKDSRVPHISCGFTMYVNEYQQIRDLIKEADGNMYRNKTMSKLPNE